MKHKKCKRVAIGQSLLTQFARMMVPSTGLAIVSGKRAIDQESIWPMTDCLVTIDFGLKPRGTAISFRYPPFLN